MEKPQEKPAVFFYFLGFSKNCQNGNDYKYRFWGLFFVIINSCGKEKPQSNRQTAELSIFVKITVEVMNKIWYTTNTNVLLRSISLVSVNNTVTIVMEERKNHV